MATKVEDKVKKDQAKTAYGQADIDREMLDKRDKYEAGVSKKFGIGDSPYEKFSGPDYYKGKKAGGSCAKVGVLSSSAVRNVRYFITSSPFCNGFD